MSSGYPGGDFFGHAGIGGGPAMDNVSARMLDRSRLGGYHLDPLSSYAPVLPQQSSLAKRPLSDMEMMHQRNLLLRSVKQRTSLTSPPADLSSALPAISLAPARIGASSVQQPQQKNNCSSFGISFSGAPNGPDREKNMRSRLQELERQLFNDDDDGGDGGEGSAVSALTTSGWNETMQNLIAPKPIPTSPTTSSSSSTMTTASTSPSPPSSSPPSSIPKQLLFDSATAISEGKMEAAAAILSRLRHLSSPRSGDAEQRLAAYMVSALLYRMNPLENGLRSPIPDLRGEEQLLATKMLYEASPCFKLAFMATNSAILDATRDSPKIHIVDFDIGRGSQYFSLIQTLASSSSAKTVTITAATDPGDAGNNGPHIVGECLSKLAEHLGIRFRFHVLRCCASDLTRDSIGCDSDESLVVNFAFLLHGLADESVSTANPRDGLLRVVRGLRPAVVTLAEQQMNANTAPFLTRFAEVWTHHCSLFQSLESTMAAPTRIRIEECLARKAFNAVAREGRDRVERCEVLGKWCVRMTMAGFQPRPFPPHIAASLHDLARQTHQGFAVGEQSGGIFFSWMGKNLTFTSAWH